MTLKNKGKIVGWIFLFSAGAWLTSVISSCGKATTASPTGLNIRYEVLNLSPDVLPIDIYIKLLKVNTTSFSYSINQGYFYVTALDTPYVIRQPIHTGGGVILRRDDVLKTGLSYSLFIVGNVSDNSILPIFTVDTASLPAVGRAKVRFVNASPTATAGLDVTANGTTAFSKITYPNYSKYIELPNGNYDFQLSTTGSGGVLKTLTGVTLQDGRLYTLYAYGYSNRADRPLLTPGL